MVGGMCSMLLRGTVIYCCAFFLTYFCSHTHPPTPPPRHPRPLFLSLVYSSIDKLDGMVNEALYVIFWFLCLLVVVVVFCCFFVLFLATTVVKGPSLRKLMFVFFVYITYVFLLLICLERAQAETAGASAARKVQKFPFRRSQHLPCG